jgi:dolichol-phosphate mannosyltransferase
MPADVLVIVPTYKEKENIAALCESLLALPAHVDVLIVDDESPDGTADAVKALQPTYGERLQLMQRKGKGGRGSAVLDGFKYALNGSYQFVFEMDADFSHKPEEIPLFLEKIKDADMVIGSRYLPGSEIHHWGLKRTVFSRWANRFARAMLRIPMSDYTNGFRCYRRSAIEALEMSRIDAKGYVVLSEVAYQLFLKGKKIAEVPTVFVNRRRGISNLSKKEILEAFQSVVRIRRTYEDMRKKASRS